MALNRVDQPTAATGQVVINRAYCAKLKIPVVRQARLLVAYSSRANKEPRNKRARIDNVDGTCNYLCYLCTSGAITTYDDHVPHYWGFANMRSRIVNKLDVYTHKNKHMHLGTNTLPSALPCPMRS